MLSFKELFNIMDLCHVSIILLAIMFTSNQSHKVYITLIVIYAAACYSSCPVHACLKITQYILTLVSASITSLPIAKI